MNAELGRILYLFGAVGSLVNSFYYLYLGFFGSRIRVRKFIERQRRVEHRVGRRNGFYSRLITERSQRTFLVALGLFGVLISSVLVVGYLKFP